MSSPKIAAIDVGSNTVRLLLAEREERADFRPLRVERRITRLGGNFSAEKMLDEKAMFQTVAALRDFADLLRPEKAAHVFAVATGVVREAGNGEDFIARVFEKTGFSLRLISGEEEARLMLKGVCRSLPETDAPRLIADVGGWSTEILWIKGKELKRIFSLQLGAVALSEKFLKNDPPKTRELLALGKYAQGILEETRKGLTRSGLKLSALDSRLAGTAGTATTLAAIDQKLAAYDPRKINGHVISRSGLKKIYFRLCSLTVEDRRKIPGLEKGREDLIVAGAEVIFNILKVFHLEALFVIDSGLLEGVLLDGISRLS